MSFGSTTTMNNYEQTGHCAYYRWTILLYRQGDGVRRGSSWQRLSLLAFLPFDHIPSEYSALISDGNRYWSSTMLCRFACPASIFPSQSNQCIFPILKPLHLTASMDAQCYVVAVQLLQSWLSCLSWVSSDLKHVSQRLLW